MRGKASMVAAAGAEIASDSAPIYDGRLLRRLWIYVRPHRRLLGAALLLLPLASLLALLQPYLIKLIIDEAIVPGRPGLLAPLAGMVMLALLLERLTLYGETLLLEKCGQRAMHELRVAAHAHLLAQRSAFFDRSQAGKLLSRVTGDVESISEAFSQGLVIVIGDLLTFIGILAAMLWLSPRLALITLTALPLLFVLAHLARKLIRQVQRDIRRRMAQINGSLQEHLSGIKIVQIFGRQAQAAAEFEEVNGGYRQAYRQAIRYESSLYALVELLGTVTVALLLWYGGLRLAEGALTFGLLVAFIEYAQKLFAPVRDLSLKFSVMQQAMAAAERVFGLLDTDELEPEVLPAPPPAAAPGAPAHVVFERVSFGYDPKRPVLRDVSLQIPRGQSLAVVGATGAGKTSLIRLLTRLYQPQAGAILLEGQDVRTLPLRELRRRVVVVSQDVFLFGGTIAENISLGDPQISGAQLEAAAQAVGLDRHLSLERQVLDRGENLSAGERQLVAFARALARDPELLVLDEATASIDPETERLIQEGIAELLRGRTAIVIAHRLSTIESSDAIVVLQHGRVAEQGTHQQLSAAGGLFAKLRELQVVRGRRPEQP